MKQLIFVYNADSHLMSAAMNYVTKIVAPKSYGCRLCGITYGLTGEKREWKEYLNKLEYDKQFLHKDEIIRENPKLKDTKFPAVFLKEKNNYKLIIPAEEINKQHNLNELKDLVDKKLPK